MPGANIARISRIQIQVISPSPASQIMANDETVAVEVKTSGGSVQQAFLETFTESQGFLKSKMVKTEDGRFAANIHLREETVEYRVMAGDAITKRFTINTRSRPHILEFHKIFEFPEYTRLPT